MIAIQPRIPTVTLYSPSVSVHSTDEEHRYFQVFTEDSAFDIPCFFDSTFWTTVVLQEAHAIAPIRHAVIAIGALYKSLDNAPDPQLKVNIIQTIDKKHHERAVLYFLKSIQELNHYISASSSPQLRVALISCLLFVCFETFQGSFASSVQQLYGGLKILRSYYHGKPGSRPWIPRRSLPEPLSAEANQINKALQIRIGCDSVSKERAIAMHLEEYLGESQPQTKSEKQIFGVAESYVYDPQVEQVEASNFRITGTDFHKEQQETMMALPVKERLLYSSNRRDSATSQNSAHESIVSTSHSTPIESRASSQDVMFKQSPGIRKSSSSFSNSSPTTSAADTHHVPSPAYPPSRQIESTALKGSSTSRTPTPSPILQNDLTIEDALIQTFVRLDGQGLFFGMIPGIPPLIWDIHKAHHIPIPEIFSDFASAHRCWDFLMDRALQFYRRTLFNRAFAPASREPDAQIARQHASYVKQFADFERAFKYILDEAIDPDGTISNPAALILSIYRRTTLITLASVRNDCEMVYDSYLPDFQYIVQTCATLIAAQAPAQRPRNPRFSFEVGIIPPLHVTATKCRDPILRRKAIDLMFSSPRQEGMWDSVLVGRIAKWLINCEEDGLPPPPLESRESSVSRSPSESGSLMEEQLSYPSPPHAVDEVDVGLRKSKKRVREGSEVIEAALTEYSSKRQGGAKLNSVGLYPNYDSMMKEKRRKNGVSQGKEKDGQQGWIVPEENRVQLMVVDFHIPDRYIQVKCQKALLREDGSREERETLIAW